MKRWIHATTGVLTAEEVKEELNKLVQEGKVPANGTIVKTQDDYEGTTYNKVKWHIYDDELDELIEDYGSDIIDYLITNNIFLMLLPDDPYGGVALGDVTSWKQSSLEEAEADNYGNDEGM